MTEQNQKLKDWIKTKKRNEKSQLRKQQKQKNAQIEQNWGDKIDLADVDLTQRSRSQRKLYNMSKTETALG